MSFFSTRGQSVVTASQAILHGLAPDGGLYVPAMFPTVPTEKITRLCEMDYAQRAVEILKLYLEDFSIPEIEQAVRAAYSPERFDTPEIAPVKRIDDVTWVMELFHGPTLAFKDMALQLLPHLTRLSAEKNGEKREISILVATSGDTGKAALEGFRDAWRIVECGKEIPPELKQAACGLCRIRDGYTLLVRKEDADPAGSREATLEEIMIHLEKEAEEV